MSTGSRGTGDRLKVTFSTNSPGADSKNLDFVAPPEEHRIYGIFSLFGLPASILKTLPL